MISINNYLELRRSISIEQTTPDRHKIDTQEMIAMLDNTIYIIQKIGDMKDIESVKSFLKENVKE